MSSKNEERALKTRRLMDRYETIDAAFVAERLGCGHGQAVRAIQRARYMAAEDGKRVSYATARNEYSVALEGDTTDRTDSYMIRQRSIITQRVNAGRVMVASVDHAQSSRLERGVAKLALADATSAQADKLRLEAFQEIASP